MIAGEESKTNYESVSGLVAITESCLMLQKGKARVVGIHDQSISGNFSHILVSSIDHGDYENLNLLSVEEQQTKPITEFGNEYVILRWSR